MDPTKPGDDPPRIVVPPPAYTVSPSGYSADEAKGLHLDASVPPLSGAAPSRDSIESIYVTSRRKRQVVRPVLLFVATCLSTFWAGATHWRSTFSVDSLEQAKLIIQANWRDGLVYMTAVMAILLMHEMGHFVQTIRYRVPASLPLFLPVPLLMGTMGAVIVMDPSKANRKQLFDIGLWGPWAGLIVAIPMIWFGIHTAELDPTAADFPFETPLVFKLITKLIVAYGRPDLAGAALKNNPLFMAGWVGMLVTGLNMLPVSQLDGGHVIYGLFGRDSKWIARAFVIAAIGFIVVTEQYNWIVMLVLVLMLGVDHPPTGDDSVPLGPVRWTIGLVSLLIPVFCFTPVMMPGG